MISAAATALASAEPKPHVKPETVGRTLFQTLYWSCAGADFAAFEGEDDWLPNKMTRQKLVIVTWHDGLKAMTKILDRNGNFQGISCTGGRVDLLVYGRNDYYDVQPFQIGTSIAPLPVEATNIASGYGPPINYAGINGPLGRFFGTKGYFDMRGALGTTAKGQPVIFSMKRTGSLKPGGGYTSTELVKMLIGDPTSQHITVVDWDNFDPAD